MRQVKNIGADFCGIGVPAFLPVTVDFPRNPRKGMPVVGAPLAKGGMGPGKTRVRSKVSGGGHLASGQFRAVNPVIAGKRLRDLRTNLDGSIGVQIHGHVPARARETGGANERPDLAARGRNELGKFFRLHATAHHGDGSRFGIGESDGVGHGVHIAERPHALRRVPIIAPRTKTVKLKK